MTEQDYGKVSQLRLKLLKATGLGAPQAAAATGGESGEMTVSGQIY